MELIMGPPMGGIGACTTINTRGLLENIAVRAQVDCPLPANNLQLLAWARKATLHGLRNLLIDNISPLMNVAIGCAYYRLAPWAANLLLMVGMDKGNPLHNVAFFATTDVMHALPTMPLCNSAIHRILDEKPVQGVCVRIRSGPETVSRTAAEHLDSATASFRGLRMLVLERVVYHMTFTLTTTLLATVSNHATLAPWLTNYPLSLEALSIFVAGLVSYPFELLRNVMVVSEMDELTAFGRIWDRDSNGLALFWSGFWASVPRLMLRPLHQSAQYSAELSLVRRWGFGIDLQAEIGDSVLPNPPGLVAATAIYASLLEFGRSQCGVLVWNRLYSWPDLPASACGLLPLVGLVQASWQLELTGVVSGLSLEQYYTVFALGALLQTAWKLATLLA
eukprot:m.52929 g.52929  ORF g.52929 m.52929 type:complete len:393 (+) comp9133_c0_seq1:220-1398(+)